MTDQAKNNRLGEYVISSVGEERYRAYIPAPLPPDPPLDMTRLYPLLDQASTALGRLDGMSMILPDPSLFLYMYVRKEAVLSSQIEGTQSSLSDLLLFEVDEAPGAPLDDVTEVSCYVAALNYGLTRLNDLPLSLRLLREIHAHLMNNARGGNKILVSSGHPRTGSAVPAPAMPFSCRRRQTNSRTASAALRLSFTTKPSGFPSSSRRRLPISSSRQSTLSLTAMGGSVACSSH